VGGHVEALAAGVYRNDIEENFTLDTTKLKEVSSLFKSFDKMTHFVVMLNV
jgi:hypothetical protein